MWVRCRATRRYWPAPRPRSHRPSRLAAARAASVEPAPSRRPAPSPSRQGRPRRETCRHAGSSARCGPPCSTCARRARVARRRLRRGRADELTEDELTSAFFSRGLLHQAQSRRTRQPQDPARHAAPAHRPALPRLLRAARGLQRRGEAPDGSGLTEEEIVARLMSELDAEELPEDWLQQQKGGD